MGTYRFGKPRFFFASDSLTEEAKTGRAGCQNKECKDAKLKIPKGELRVGSWVDSGNFQSWYWRHWGCVTPKMIHNIMEALDELDDSSGDQKNFTLLDGFDELPEEFQATVQKALEQGHVDDKDWKGTGFRVRGKKADDEHMEESPKKATSAKKRGHADDDDADKKPTKKAKAVKKVAKDEGADSKPAKNGTKVANDATHQETEQKSKRGRSKKAKAETDDAEAKPKRGRPKRTKTSE
ncbi:hypothetical protein N7474_004153 [Penicillium riverlandense]|uniref:uncharacterized protein n=1 Tax=Penicillium riverlandense TaxID=1903569 RepID=UPI002548E3F3|nr:uncharacterized protein N7474_004153 [Penicillium riverlandense]KAJ5818562.1 hypothetical protein N7474_004153 [Penicillium riverlandense]